MLSRIQKKIIDKFLLFCIIIKELSWWERGIFLDKYNEEFDEDNYDDNEIRTTVVKPKKMSAKSQLLIVIQLILCGIILGGAFIVKSIGGQLYATVGTWFYDNYNNSVFTDTQKNIIPFIDKITTTENNGIFSKNENSSSHSDIINKIKKSFHKPLDKGIITSTYGNRGENSNKKFHKGIDIAADKNSPIYAMLDGTVTISEKDDSYGNYIVITHSDNIKTLYAHCSKSDIKQGEKVTAGQQIALVGSTGDSDGNHLHLEVIIDGENINPQEILGKEYSE